MQCYLSVRGPIEAGDVEKIREAMADFTSIHTEDAGLFYPNSMNSWRKVCFDSIGGSFDEGVRIAQYLLSESIGSAVPRNAQCLSACAVAFMGGTNDTKEDGGKISFRQLHPLGKLGFHAPFIDIPKRNYSNNVVQGAFEGALKNIGFLLERGDEMKFPRSLVLRMLSTPSDDMHFVATVGEASRWGIAIAPVVPRETLEPASVVNACYNQEAYIQDIPLPIFADASNVVMEKDGSTEIGRLPYGFRGERAAPCEIRQPAVSDYARYGPLTHRAIHDITEYSGVYPYQMYDPLTPIEALSSAEGESAARIPQFVRRSEADAVCLVIGDGRLMDSEQCRWETVKTRNANMSVEEVWKFHWPSGSQTVVLRGTSSKGQGDALNGAPARRIETWDLSEGIRKAIESAAGSLEVPENSWLSESCWFNSSTERLFCVGSYGNAETTSAKGFFQ